MYTFTNEAKIQVLVLALAAVVTFVVLLFMGDMEGPEAMPYHPSANLYSSTG